MVQVLQRLSNSLVLTYLAGRLLQTLPVLLLASIFVFLILRLIPGDPAALLAGEDATPEQVQQLRVQMGLTDPLPVQYARWLGDVLHGNLGTSLASGLPVSRLLEVAVRPTVELVAVAYPLAILIGIPLGAKAGASPGSISDWLLTGYSTLALGIPSFLVGILLLYVFSVQLGWLPSSGQVSFADDPLEALRHLALPAIALGGAVAAVLARYTRTAIISVMDQDHIRTARAKGLSDPQVVYRHALRASLIPIVTIAALQVGQLLAGAFVVEQIFTRPGLGRLMVDAIQGRDYTVVQSTLLLLVVTFVGVNLVADIAYGFLDPRLRQR
jgi:peptide/nickel transport system permease protein